ncbi:MAG: hypothetical protein ACRCVJ_02900 [Clostridium sp.]|uniref:hypothetical protein n=1 Tax=Clostridium sp. TaxID=1506 RepID=UPI003F2E291F
MNPIAKPVQMIAWFDMEGKINPVRFKYEEEDEDCKVVCINRILNREFEKLAGNPMWKFTCSSIVDGVENTYSIKYDLLTNRWLLFLNK